jgi:hypothetical protein
LKKRKCVKGAKNSKSSLLGFFGFHWTSPRDLEKTRMC